MRRLIQAVKLARVVAQDHSGQLPGALVGDFVIAKHGGERPGERFAAARIGDVADLFPACIGRSVGVCIGGEQHLFGNIFQPGAQVLG